MVISFGQYLFCRADFLYSVKVAKAVTPHGSHTRTIALDGAATDIIIIKEKDNERKNTL